MAANDEVSTTRRASASRAARSTRSTPSRAGMIRSSGSFGWTYGSGDATWYTSSHPVTAAFQPSSGGGQVGDDDLQAGVADAARGARGAAAHPPFGGFP